MQVRDFRISKKARDELFLAKPVFLTNESLKDLYKEANDISYLYNQKLKADGEKDSSFLSPGKLHASAVLHLLYQIVLSHYLRDENPDYFTRTYHLVANDDELLGVLSYFDKQFPSPLIEKKDADPMNLMYETERGFFIHEVLLANPALVAAAKPFVAPKGYTFPKATKALNSIIGSYMKDDPRNDVRDEEDIFFFLTNPSRLYPNSLTSQIRYILREWAVLLPDELKLLLQSSLDFIREEEKDRGVFGGGGPAPTYVPNYANFDELNEYEAFSDDTNWMPNVVMMAKSTLVWLDQLSKWYQRPINTLDQIPNEELDALRERGFTALWLIGLWERSTASKTIKHLCGNPDAEASAYSLKDYEIAESIGGWAAVDNLRQRCNERGIRLASDMVPNHTGIDGNWVYDHPEYFVKQDYPPFPSYSYNGPDLSLNPDIEIKLEDHYFDRTDAAVTFLRRDKRSGKTEYVFHGNDGTTMPWNDTAQIDYLNPEAREAVVQKILLVARNFPIIRFDAAMTLAKRHIQRLWYPKPGTGGDIAGRSVHAISDYDFNAKIPQEFWREIVDRIAKEVPDTLLLAEAFWMMEGYFVRTLGMHRVYNSAFMNMLKNQENAKYRQAIKNTIAFEPEILKRYVNFMNNPDEDTAVAQFGDGNRYFGVATLLSTLPGLPMFGHGQIEGFREKYGMEYKRAYWDEKPNDWIVSEHYKRIFPLLKKRYLFSGVEYFQLYDAWNEGRVEESVYAYSNGVRGEKTIVLVNNQYERVWGNIKVANPKLSRVGNDKKTTTSTLAESLDLTFGGRKYVIYEDFNADLTYIVPSIKIFEEGLSFSLDGYDSKVLWNIREVEDTDGSYEKLYKYLNGNGVKNINLAIALLRLSPVYKMLENFRSAAFFKLLETLFSGNGTSANERSILLNLAESYVTLFEMYKTLEPSVREELPSHPRDIDPSKMSNLFKAITTRFKATSFKAWSKIAPELPLLLASALIIEPFLDKNDDSFIKALRATDKLLLSYFFERSREKLNIKEDELIKTIHAGAILNILINITKTVKKVDPIENLKSLLEVKEIRDFVEVNEYQGVTWYKKEAMQQLIMLSSLALAVNIKSFDPDSYIDLLFKKEGEAEYQLDKLLD